MYRKNFWCKFVIMDDFFYILFRKMILKGSNALIVKYEEDRHRHAGPSPSTGYKYVDNGFFFFFLDHVVKTKSMDVKCQLDFVF